MRCLKAIIILNCMLAIIATTGPTIAEERDLGREILAPNDGWASLGTGTTGGAAAIPAQIYIVHNRKELVLALNGGVYPLVSSIPSNAPKIIYVVGTIDVNVDDNNQPLTCQDYYRNGYTLEAFLAAYDPEVWGRTAPSGPLENARLDSQAVQEARVRIRVGSNTTIVGVGEHATILGAWLDLQGTASAPRTNIIIRNITFQDTYDCFPAWSPTDGTLGAWNALYDAISLRYTDHVWVDHNIFEDSNTADSGEPNYFGVHYERHGGQLNITRASDLVTVSWNCFRDHDKVMLIGASDSETADRGKLRTTIHHNLFENLGQRMPLVRFGQVHVYNNYYFVGHGPDYEYSWGVGIESAIYAEKNYFDSGVSPNRFIEVYKGTAIHESGTFVNGHSAKNLTDVLAVYNAANDPDLSDAVGWMPTLYTKIDPTQSLSGLILAQSGTFDW